MAQNSTNPTNSKNSELLNVFTEMLRTVARPAVTIIFAAVIAQVVIEGIDIPQWFLALAIPCITWWFAERTVTHIAERKQEDQ
jgi:hypothetical protein